MSQTQNQNQQQAITTNKIDAWINGETDLLPEGENCMAMSAAELEEEIRNPERSPEERMFLAGVLHARTYEMAASASVL